MKKILAALMVIAIAAVSASAMPHPRGRVAGDSDIRYTSLQVNRDGSISFILHNDGRSAEFSGRLGFIDKNGEVRAQTDLIRSIELPAGGSVEVTTNLEKGSYSDVEGARGTTWSGVRIRG